MAVEFLFLAEDGTDGRTLGTCINRQECGELEVPKWGSDERPPRFFIVRVPQVGFATMDKMLEDFGGHQSRLVLNLGRVPTAQKSDITAKKPKVIMTHAEFNAALDDRGANWLADRSVTKLLPPGDSVSAMSMGL